MQHTSLKEALHAVDPNLNIASGHIRHSHQDKNWERAAGVKCSVCGREFQRGRDGMCYRCWEAKMEVTPEIRDKTGILTFMPATILKQITHPSRKPKGDQ